MLRSLDLHHVLAALVFAACMAGATCDAPFSLGVDPADNANTNGNDNDNVPLPPVGAAPSPAASLLEQLSLERINRARLYPGDEAARFGIAVDEGIPGRLDGSPKQPLAMNSTLRSAALAHSEDMLARNYFEHDTPEGLSPFDRMRTEGFLFATAGENLAWRGSTGTLDAVQTTEDQHEDLFVDRGIDSRGHRITMLNGDYREVGIAIVRGSFTRASDGIEFTDSFMQTQDFGATSTGAVFVLGVVYDDDNRNGRYDYGEGIANAAVTLGEIVKTTNQAGGYSFRVNETGTYSLKFAFGPSQSVTLADGDQNIKIDLVDRSRLVTNLGRGNLN